jgi:uncharacterized peroxidase-related enzyme
MTFALHTHETAPEASRAAMAAVEQKLGFLPNLLREMAEAPVTLMGYLALGDLLAETSLSPVEQQLVLASASLANRCEYCVAAHSAGLRQAGFPPDQLEALREQRALADPQLEALRAFVAAVVDTRGRPDAEVLAAFRAAGYGNRQILEVMLGVGMKTISNYVNHIADTPLDPQLRAFAWSAEAQTGPAYRR